MSDKIVAKSNNPSIDGFKGFVSLREATGRQAQYVSRYIEAYWSRKEPENYPYLGEGLQLLVARPPMQGDDWILLPYEEGKSLGDYSFFYLSIEDAKVFKERVDAQYAASDAFFSRGRK